MFLDARSLPHGEVLHCQVCIVGAGAAGITLARELRGRDFKVVLLESGGIEPDEPTTDLSRGRCIGQPHGGLDVTRLRYFGGTTNHWGGWCRPFDEIDFETRDWVPYSGWPIGKAELDPYYETAQHYCELGGYNYDADYWTKRIIDHDVEPLRIPGLISAMFQFSPPTRFGEVYGDDLRRAKNVQVFLYANVTNINLRPDAGSVKSVSVKTLQGNSFTVSATLFVLATGGIENARLLLLSNDVARRGVGNQHDLVGRFFMEHPHLEAGQLLFSAGHVRTDLYDRYYTYGHLPIGASLCLAPRIQRQARLLNSRLDLNSVFEGEASEGTKALKHVYRSLRRGEIPDEFIESLGAIIRDVDEVAVAVYGHLTRPPERLKHVSLFFALEQAPNPDSRISLDTSRDALGLNRVLMDWKLLEIDHASLVRTLHLMANAFGAEGLGRVKRTLGHDPQAWLDNAESGWHHMGTTRMSDSPATGVVDRNCRVHGVGNLYIAGSSVFPTGGAGVPTLTIVALAVRLAAHLQRQLDVGLAPDSVGAQER